MKIEALKIIITKSPSCATEAGNAIKAIGMKSPASDLRCSRVAISALEDTDANFSEDERAAIADLISDQQPETRGYTLRIRLTDSERIELEGMADAEELSLSEYARKKIF